MASYKGPRNNRISGEPQHDLGEAVVTDEVTIYFPEYQEREVNLRVPLFELARLHESEAPGAVTGFDSPNREIRGPKEA